MAIEVWFLRRMLQMSFMEKKSNLETLRATGVQYTNEYNSSMAT